MKPCRDHYRATPGCDCPICCERRAHQRARRKITDRQAKHETTASQRWRCWECLRLNVGTATCACGLNRLAAVTNNEEFEIV